MRPEWFEKTSVPFHLMWEDDHLWFPFMLQSKLFYGYFVFDGDKLLNYELKELQTLSNLHIPKYRLQNNF